MSNTGSFSYIGVWSPILLIVVILISLVVATVIKQNIKPLKQSLIPVSVLGGILLLAVSTVLKLTTGDYLFNLPLFVTGAATSGMETLETLTYHCLAIGFISMTLRKSNKPKDKQRTIDVFNTGLLTVNTYLMQVVLGMIITFIASFFIPQMLKCSGILLAFGYGQGTGQALNYGQIYESYGFVGGKSFGLAIAALGFLSAGICGVIFLDYNKRHGRVKIREDKYRANSEKVEDEGEIPMIESIDKITVQVALIAIAYSLAYALMFLLSRLLPGMVETVFGFNFLFGALMGVLVKSFLSFLHKKNIVKRDYINNFLLNRIGGFSFDIMIVAGIGAIRLDLIANYWFVLLLMGVVGALSTYYYNHFVCFKLFKGYENEQFLASFGMLTGTASTGVILLREIDPNFETPASENLVYQNFPAIIFGFPLMIFASAAPESDTATYVAFAVALGLFIILNILMFRRQIFKKNK